MRRVRARPRPPYKALQITDKCRANENCSMPKGKKEFLRSVSDVGFASPGYRKLARSDHELTAPLFRHSVCCHFFRSVTQ